MKKHGFLAANGLSIVLFLLFAGFLAGQAFTGYAVYNQERVSHGAAAEPLARYLASGHFISATFENWESEFLQMGMYVLLTVALRQRGSAESRPMDPALEQERVEAGPTPWPLRRGGVWRWLYARSLWLAYAVLFMATFAAHAFGSWLHENDQRAMDGQAPQPLLEHLASAQLWFESLQNWQSEFLAVLSIVVLSIFLRQDKSPQSKPLAAPHSQTGT